MCCGCMAEGVRWANRRGRTCVAAVTATARVRQAEPRRRRRRRRQGLRNAQGGRHRGLPGQPGLVHEGDAQAAAQQHAVLELPAAHAAPRDADARIARLLPQNKFHTPDANPPPGPTACRRPRMALQGPWPLQGPSALPRKSRTLLHVMLVAFQPRRIRQREGHEHADPSAPQARPRQQRQPPLPRGDHACRARLEGAPHPGMRCRGAWSGAPGTGAPRGARPRPCARGRRTPWRTPGWRPGASS